MKHRLDEDVTHRELARVAHLSPHHFNRVFRQITGIPPLYFLYALRLEAAKQLLLNTRRSITDICLDVGYNSLGTFISRFTRLVGRSPRHLRQAEHGLPGSGELLRMFPAAQAESEHPPAWGTVHAPECFTGLILVGLFREPIPQGRPAGCAVLPAGGSFHIAFVPDGDYYICAVALPRSDKLPHQLPETTPRGRSGPVAVRQGKPTAPVHVLLRPPQPTDPPILLSLPLLAEALGLSARGTAALPGTPE
jgi:AraC-like DNA-binding protein